MKLGCAGVVVGVMFGCTRPNPEFCDTNTACKNGQVCDLDTNRCAAARDAPADDTSSSSDSPSTIDAKAACVRELLFQRDGLFTGGQVYRINLVDFVEHRVSNGVDVDIGPSWSPDGTRIAVTRNASTVWTIDPDGGNGHQVDTQPDNFLLYPVWSHDGTRLAYEGDPKNGGLGQLYSAAVSGSSGINLTPGSDGEGPVEWSPDDSKILFVSRRTGNADVFKMSANGGNAVNLTNRAGNDGVEGPHWMHGGIDIVFGANHVWTAAADGSNLLNLTGTTGSEDHPVWSSDDKIYFVKDFSSSGLLYVMNSTGANQHPLMNTQRDGEPVPSPDGAMIAWVSGRDGNSEIYVANSDGGNATRLTNNSAPDTFARWRPCPP